MSESNLDDVIGGAEEAKPEPKTSRAKKPAAPKAPVAPARENPIPLAEAQGELLPGDQGYNYQKEIDRLGQVAVKLTEEATAVKQAARQLNVLMQSKQPVRSDYDRWLQQKENNAKLQAEKNEKQMQVQTVLKEMGLI